MAHHPICNDDNHQDPNMCLFAKNPPANIRELEPWMGVWPMGIIRRREIRPGDILPSCEEINMRDNIHHYHNQTKDHILFPRLNRFGMTREDHLLSSKPILHEIPPLDSIHPGLRRHLPLEMTPTALNPLPPPHAQLCTHLRRVRTKPIPRILTFDMRRPKFRTPWLCHELPHRVELYPNVMMIDPCP